jgi:PKD repeat protein
MERAFHTLAVLAAVALASGCTVHEAPAPSPTGPSELSLSLTVAATPDTITQDGSSQALVVVVARDVGGRAVANLPIRFDVMKDGQVVDYGALSTKSGLTGADGRVQAVYTAPTPPPNSADFQASVVSVLATPVGTNYASVVPREVVIRLVPPGQILPPGTGPASVFTYTWPGSQGAGVPVAFDASESSSPAGLASYGWDFGDGTSGSGVAVQHVYSVAGTYVVRLTVTDRKGQTAWSTQRVTVAPGPTALFTWTPPTPTHGLPVTFDASMAWAMPPSSIVSYAWDFGDGWSGSGVTAFHAYAAAGSYTVKLTVTASSGLVGSLTLAITVQ